MKVGFLLDYLKFRVDILELVKGFQQQEGIELVLFVEKSQAHWVDPTCTIRIIEYYPPTNFHNRLILLFYDLFGTTPTPPCFFYFKKRQMLQKANSGKFKLWVYYWFRILLPKFLSFDQMLSWYRPFVNKSIVADIDVFLVLTPHEQNDFLALIAQTDKPIFAYQHSWDHSFKFKKISTNRFHYLTWGDLLSEDLQTAFSIPPSQTSTIGSSQLALLNKISSNNITNESSSNSEPYIYFVAAFGYKAAAIQEVKLVKEVAKRMELHAPALKLVFRQYPLLRDNDVYQELQNIENLVFDDYSIDGKDMLLSYADVEHRVKMIAGATAVFHAGTTVGLEAAFLDRNVVYLCCQPEEDSSTLSLSAYWKQYHLKRYYYNTNFPNVVTEISALGAVIQAVASKDDVLNGYSTYLRRVSQETNYAKIIHNINDGMVRILKNNYNEKKI